jgi:hypothetical protein
MGGTGILPVRWSGWRQLFQKRTGKKQRETFSLKILDISRSDN